MRGRTYAMTAVAGVVLWWACHLVATAQRGYEAVGGEFLFLLTPVWAWMAAEVVREVREGGRRA